MISLLFSEKLGTSITHHNMCPALHPRKSSYLTEAQSKEKVVHITSKEKSC